MRCTAKTSAGKSCRANAILGGMVCNKHGGSSPVVKAKAAVRAEVSTWVLGDATDDPGEVLLRLVTQSRRRADAYALELERVAMSYENLADALVGDSMITGADGSVHKAGEYIRGLVVLESQERDRCATFAAKAIAAGLAERQVRLAESQGAMIAQVLRTVIASLGLGRDQEEEALRVTAGELRRLSAA